MLLVNIFSTYKGILTKVAFCLKKVSRLHLIFFFQIRGWGEWLIFKFIYEAKISRSNSAWVTVGAHKSTPKVDPPP